jgi:hypothetical protein
MLRHASDSAYSVGRVAWENTQNGSIDRPRAVGGWVCLFHAIRCALVEYSILRVQRTKQIYQSTLCEVDTRHNLQRQQYRHQRGLS